MASPPASGEGTLDCTIYVGATDASDIPALERRRADELLAGVERIDRPALLLVDASMLDHSEAIARLPREVVLMTTDEASAVALGPRADGSIAGITDGDSRLLILRLAAELACSRRVAARRRASIVRILGEVRELNRIGLSLMSEHDHAALLHGIMQQAKRMTGSDAGVIMLAETDAEHTALLRAVLYEFDSLPDLVAEVGSIIPVNNATIIGHAALVKQPVIVPDVYQLPSDADYGRSTAFDLRHHYRSRSMLVVPMLDQRGQLEGVLVLVNRKSDPTAAIRDEESADRWVLPFTSREVRLARSLAGQAAVSIENARLYSRIERIFEGFVTAAVTAIDQRDPSTAGHSVRVAALATDLAMMVDHSPLPGHEPIHFTRAQLRELRFAALLHDFGKVAVREDVLTKAKKLPAALWERVNARFDLIRQTLVLEHYRSIATATGGASASQNMELLETELSRRLEEVDRLRRLVVAANQPSSDGPPPVSELRDIARRTFMGPDGRAQHYLTPDELHYLELSEGNLDERERAQIQAHVEETYRFLAGIPWTDDLGHVAMFAYGHHEKLDGSGYPKKLMASDIPMQTRIITIADMYDALTESNRPYRPALTPERALDLLRAEARAGHLDAELVRLLGQSEVQRRMSEMDWREL